MSRGVCCCAQGRRGAVASITAILCGALLSLLVLAPHAWAAESADADDVALAMAQDASGEDAAVAPEEDPIKPRPRVEITTGVVTLEPAEDDAIVDEAIPLAAFDIEPCFIHLLMVCGIAATIGYTFFAYRRTCAHTRHLDDRVSELTDGLVTSSEPARAVSVPASVGAPVSADQ